MSKIPTAIVFDVDGVLLDSLASHLKICRDLNNELKAGLDIPDRESFKNDTIRAGILISPMIHFFEAVGFKGDDLITADQRYQATFATKYESLLFDKVPETLEILTKRQIKLGLATDNTRKNIEKSLHSILHHFDKERIFTNDDRSNKETALVRISNNLKCDIGEIVFVGDQYKDYNAAVAVGAQFIGVNYGWGITDDDDDFEVIGSFDKLLSVGMP